MNSVKFIFLSNKLIKLYLLVAFYIVLIFQTFDCNSQNLFRRHFIIACDASNSFNSRNQASIVETQSWLENYFNNEFPSGTNGKFDIIREEFKNGKVRFIPNRDEITFYNFNLTDNDIASNITGEQDSLKITSKISELFFKNPGINWTTFPQQNIVDYFRETFNPFQAKRELTNFTIPNLVYPLIINRVDYKSFAEEYVLIILTKTTPEPLNIVDFHELRTRIGKEIFAEHYLKNLIKILSSNFTKTDYFNYPDYGIFAYFITPKNVSPGTAATAVSIDSNIKLTQKGYKTEKFQFSTIKMHFPQNELLKPSEIRLKTIKQSKNIGDTIFNNIIDKNHYTESWSLKQLHKIGLIKNNPSFSHNIKNLKVNIDQINLKKEERNFDSLILLFEFKCHVNTHNNNSLNYLFYAESLLPIQNIDYIEDDEYFLSHVILPIAGILLILLIIVAFLLIVWHRGKVHDVSINIEGFNDNYMSVENKTVSKYNCWFWKGITQNSIRVSGEVYYKNHKIKLKGKPKLKCWIEDLTKKDEKSLIENDDFEYAINDDWNKTGCEMWIPISTENNKYEFDINIRLRNRDKPDFKKRNILRFKLKIKISSRVFGILPFTKKKEIPTYEFCLREYIGKMWVGLDPGTTGSCIAVGNGGPITQPYIFEAYETRGSNRIDIIPSKLIIPYKLNNNIIKKEPEEMDPLSHYIWGNDAQIVWTDSIIKGDNCYQSIKKLLGYKNKIAKSEEDNDDLIIAHFEGNIEKKFQGKKLVYLLIKGLVQTLDVFILRSLTPSQRRKLSEDGPPKPLRAIVAVPNNYTLPKIQEMVDSIKDLKKFKEIGYIYETEGILFNYMSKGGLPKKTETVMVFDMGGATINSSIFKIIPKNYEGRNTYKVETLGKIGFAGGGDNIDFALMESIFDMVCVNSAIEQQKRWNKEDLKRFKLENKSKILAMIFELKLDIIKMSKVPNYICHLSNPSAFKIMMNDKPFSLNINTSNWDEKDLYALKKDKNNVINLVSNGIFKQYVFTRIEEAVLELINSVFAIKKGSVNIERKIDKLIFSGRSILFPYVKSTVREALKSRNIEFDDWTGFNEKEIKSAVAYGACWYGMYNNMVHLDNSLITSNYGVVHTEKGISEFVTIIKQNEKFNKDGKFENHENIVSHFNEDSNQIDFFQITSAKPSDSVKKIEENKHKMNFLGRIPVDASRTERIKMNIDDKDNIGFEVIFSNKDSIKNRNEVANDTRDIAEDNDDAYVFSVSDDEIKKRNNSV